MRQNSNRLDREKMGEMEERITKKKNNLGKVVLEIIDIHVFEIIHVTQTRL